MTILGWHALSVVATNSSVVPRFHAARATSAPTTVAKGVARRADPLERAHALRVRETAMSIVASSPVCRDGALVDIAQGVAPNF